MLVDVLIASPSVVAIVGVKSLIYGALSLQMLRAASWARSGFTVLLGVDAADTLLDAWLLIGIPADVPHVPLLVGSEISFDAVYAYSVFLLYRDSSTAWFTGVQAQARKSPA